MFIPILVSLIIAYLNALFRKRKRAKGITVMASNTSINTKYLMYSG